MGQSLTEYVRAADAAAAAEAASGDGSTQPPLLRLAGTECPLPAAELHLTSSLTNAPRVSARGVSVVQQQRATARACGELTQYLADRGLLAAPMPQTPRHDAADPAPGSVDGGSAEAAARRRALEYILTWAMDHLTRCPTGKDDPLFSTATASARELAVFATPTALSCLAPDSVATLPVSPPGHHASMTVQQTAMQPPPEAFVAVDPRSGELEAPAAAAPLMRLDTHEVDRATPPVAARDRGDFEGVAAMPRATTATFDDAHERRVPEELRLPLPKAGAVCAAVPGIAFTPHPMLVLGPRYERGDVGLAAAMALAPTSTALAPLSSFATYAAPTDAPTASPSVCRLLAAPFELAPPESCDAVGDDARRHAGVVFSPRVVHFDPFDHCVVGGP
jgi:hypothetical protein